MIIIITIHYHCQFAKADQTFAFRKENNVMVEICWLYENRRLHL